MLDARGHGGGDGIAEEVSRSRWVAPVTLWLAIAGAAVSAYLTLAHYTTPAILACNTSRFVNCERVTTSSQSALLGIPVALLGLGWYGAMIALCAPRAWASPLRALHVARTVSATCGMAFALWLVRAELFVVHGICLWCTAVHVITFALFAIVVTHRKDRKGKAKGDT